MNRVLFISMIGEPGRYDPQIYAGQPGGDDEAHWVFLQLGALGLGQRIDYRGVFVCRGEALPGPGEADAVILGGSYHSVHDDLDWQHTTRAWLKRYRDTGNPLLAICGGHQMVARAAGADVVRSAGGTAAGTLPVQLTAAGRDHFLFAGCGGAPEFHFANSDYVTAPPAGAVVLATRDDEPATALDHGDNWYSVQFHPEASHESMAASWRPKRPKIAARYRPAVDGGTVLKNFLEGAGVV